MEEEKITHLQKRENGKVLGSFFLCLTGSLCLQSDIYWSRDHPKATLCGSSEWDSFLPKNRPCETFGDGVSVTYDFMDFSPQYAFSFCSLFALHQNP